MDNHNAVVLGILNAARNKAAAEQPAQTPSAPKTVRPSKISPELADMIRRKAVNVICFDFGHGESTAASGYLGEDESVLDFSLDETRNAVFKTPTYLCVPRNAAQECLIGDDAANQMEAAESFEFFQSFKPLLGIDIADGKVCSPDKATLCKKICCHLPKADFLGGSKPS